MSPEDVRSVAARFRTELWSHAGLANAAALVHDDCRLHVDDPITPGGGAGWEGLSRIAGLFLAAAPDLAVTVEEVIVEGDRAAVHWRMRGTHTGRAGAVEPTGRPFDVGGIDLLRVAGGKVVEARTRWDVLGLLTQLGLTPPTA